MIPVNTELHLEDPGSSTHVRIFVNFGVRVAGKKKPKNIYRRKFYVNEKAVLDTYLSQGVFKFGDTVLGEFHGHLEGKWLAIVVAENIDKGFLKELFA